MLSIYFFFVFVEIKILINEGMMWNGMSATSAANSYFHPSYLKKLTVELKVSKNDKFED